MECNMRKQAYMETMEAKVVQRAVGILLFDDVEVLDFCGPYEVFTITELQEREWPDRITRPFQVVTIAEKLGVVRCRGGLQVQPGYSIEEHPPLDILLVPGGPGTLPVLNKPAVLDWIAAQHKLVPLTTSVCTGAFLLAACGLLDGRSATTHWGGIEPLRQNYPAVDVRDGIRYIDTGNIITSAGVSAGIDMALHVVSHLLGKEVAQQTARRMEYEGLEHYSAPSYARGGTGKRAAVSPVSSTP